MTETTIGTFAAENLMNAAQLTAAIVYMREYYGSDHLPPPPLPENVVTFAPCNIKVTEIENIQTGRRVGTIKITDRDGRMVYERQWTVSEGR